MHSYVQIDIDQSPLPEPFFQPLKLYVAFLANEHNIMSPNIAIEDPTFGCSITGINMS